MASDLTAWRPFFVIQCPDCGWRWGYKVVERRRWWRRRRTELLRGPIFGDGHDCGRVLAFADWAQENPDCAKALGVIDG